MRGSGYSDVGLSKNEKKGSGNAALQVMDVFFNTMYLWDEFMMNFYNSALIISARFSMEAKRMWLEFMSFLILYHGHFRN